MWFELFMFCVQSVCGGMLWTVLGHAGTDGSVQDARARGAGPADESARATGQAETGADLRPRSHDTH